MQFPGWAQGGKALKRNMQRLQGAAQLGPRRFPFHQIIQGNAPGPPYLAGTLCLRPHVSLSVLRREQPRQSQAKSPRLEKPCRILAPQAPRGALHTWRHLCIKVRAQPYSTVQAARKTAWTTQRSAYPLSLQVERVSMRPSAAGTMPVLMAEPPMQDWINSFCRPCCSGFSR